MPFAGNFGAVLPGEVKTFLLDFAEDLGADSIAELNAILDTVSGVDINAPALIAGAPTISGTQAVQMIGVGADGFQPGVVYRWTVIATTVTGQTIIVYAHLPCAALA